MKKLAQRTLEKFLNAWQKEDYFAMFKHSQITWSHSRSKHAIEALFGGRKLESYEIIAVARGGDALLKFSCHLKLAGREPVNFIANVIRETGPYQPNETAGRCGVNPLTLLKPVESEVH